MPAGSYKGGQPEKGGDVTIERIDQGADLPLDSCPDPLAEELV